MKQNEYIKELEATISKFLKPLRNIPFPIAVKAISGYEVLPFDRTDKTNRALLDRLIKAMNIATESAYKKGIFTNRPNEVGNKIETFVKKAINSLGMRAEVPLTSRGRHQTAGYPDIFVKDVDGRTFYLECKTHNRKNIASSLRAFYFQPSKNSKITKDASHLMVSFEIIRESRRGKSAFVPVHWRLYTLEKMLVQVKHEFNASGREMYRPESLLAEGGVK